MAAPAPLSRQPNRPGEPSPAEFLSKWLRCQGGQARLPLPLLMSDLNSIKGIGSASQKLLKASGIRDVGGLASADPSELTRLLIERNQQLRILKRPPRRREVEKWLDAAREHAALAPALPHLAEATAASTPAHPEAVAIDPPPPAEGPPPTPPPGLPSDDISTPASGPDGSSATPADPSDTVADDPPVHSAAPPAAPSQAAVSGPTIPPPRRQAWEIRPEPSDTRPLETQETNGFSDDLATIACLDATGRDLLEAVGITTVSELAQSEIGDLSEEIDRANQTLRLARNAPRRAEIGKWIAAALELTADTDDIPVLLPHPLGGSAAEPEEPNSLPDEPATTTEEEEEPAGPLVNYEATDQVRELLAAAALAIPLPARVLMEAGLTVSEIAPAILLTEYSGDLDIRVGDRTPRLPRGSSAARTRAPVGSYVQIANQEPQRPEVDSSRFRKFGDAVPARQRIATARSGDATPESDRVSLIRAPLAKTNRGRDPRSRWYIRGVLHSRPWTMAIGAAVTLLLMVLLLPAMLAATMLLLAVIAPDAFHWVSPWLLALPCALPLPGIVYLMLVNKARCQICGQRQFFPRACLKNAKAHHIPILGYVASVALHMLLFRWFRCTYCGTPVRLKK